MQIGFSGIVAPVLVSFVVTQPFLLLSCLGKGNREKRNRAFLRGEEVALTMVIS